ncbi:MAG: hypothetical protein U9O98_03180 [Asgard group archaeon]|nr:hypothetical protein [Asgard group archaeon]
MRAELVQAAGQYVYLVSRPETPYYPNLLSILTFTSEGLLERVGQCWTLGSTNGFVVAGGYAYLAVVNGLEIFDVRDPTHPHRIAKYSTGCYNLFLDEAQQLLYLAAGSSGLVIVDVSAPANPTRVGKLSSFDGLPFIASDVTVAKDIAYITNGDIISGFGLINVSDPSQPRALAYYSFSICAQEVHVVQYLLYMTIGGFPGKVDLLVLNVSNCSAIVLESIHRFSGFTMGRFAVQAGFCFLTQAFTLTVSDVRNASQLDVFYSQKYTHPGLFMDVFIDDFRVFLACAWGGLEVWELPHAEAPSEWSLLLVSILVPLISVASLSIIAYVVYRKKNHSS